MTTVLLMSFTEAKNVYTAVLDQQKRTLKFRLTIMITLNFDLLQGGVKCLLQNVKCSTLEVLL